jgi:hypothetical protein
MKEIIERSSFGTKAAVRLRRRTPDRVAQRIVVASTRLSQTRRKGTRGSR